MSETVREGRHVMIIVTVKLTADKFVRSIAEALAAKGCVVTVVADGIDWPREGVGAGRIESVDIPMSRTPHPVEDLFSLAQLIRLMHRKRPDVTLYATPKAALLAAIASLLCRVPTRIYQLWGLRLETVHGPAGAFLAFLERVTSYCSTLILANSFSLAEVYRRLRLNSQRRVIVLGDGSSHGVDTRYFSTDVEMSDVDAVTDAFLQRPGMLTVGFVGRIHPDKGVDTLLEAARLCAQKGADLRYLFVGGDEGGRVSIPVELYDRVHFVGFMADPRPYYRAMDVLVLPSRREGFPNVVLEAAAMGVPAIVSDATGAVDSVLENRSGLIVPVGDAHALSAALSDLATKRSRCESLGRGARRIVEERFAQERLLGLLVAAVEEESRGSSDA